VLARIPDILNPARLVECRKALATTDWVDGRVTAGHRSERVKNNLQVPERHQTAHRLGDMILTALERNPLFVSAALPLKIVPPLFNRYEGGHAYGDHVDGAIRPVTGTPPRTGSAPISRPLCFSPRPTNMTAANSWSPTLTVRIG